DDERRGGILWDERDDVGQVPWRVLERVATAGSDATGERAAGEGGDEPARGPQERRLAGARRAGRQGEAPFGYRDVDVDQRGAFAVGVGERHVRADDRVRAHVEPPGRTKPGVDSNATANSSRGSA